MMQCRFPVSFAIACLTVFAGTPIHAQVAGDRQLAHPVVSGAAGPYAHTTLTITQPADDDRGPFVGSLEVSGGRRLTLAGPNLPDGFFFFTVRAIVFTPIDHSGANGIVILYYSSQVGPQHGTDREAMVYKIMQSVAAPQPRLQEVLYGAADASEVRRRLAKLLGRSR